MERRGGGVVGRGTLAIRGRPALGGAGGHVVEVREQGMGARGGQQRSKGG